MELCKDGQRQALASIARLCRIHELMFNSAQEGMLGLDAGGCIEFANTAAARLLGWPVETLMGKVLGHLVQCGTGAFASPFLPLRNRRDEFLTQSGALLQVECNLTPVIEDGQAQGAVITFCDIGNREHAERALHETLLALRHANERLNQTRNQLHQAEKHAAAGRAAAGAVQGVAASIGHLNENVETLRVYLGNLLQLLAVYENGTLLPPGDANAQAAIAAARRACDLDFLRADTPQLLREMASHIGNAGRILGELGKPVAPGKANT